MPEINKIIKDFWDKEVDNFYKDTHSEYLYNFFSKIKNKKSKKVLDIGCGAGRNTIMLHDLRYSVYGCDLNKKMVGTTQKRLPVKNRKNIIICDMDTLPYKKDYFDFVISNGVFHNAISYEQLHRAVSEACRVLKKEGQLVLNIFVDDNRKKVGKPTKKKHLYLTKEKLPIVLVKISELVKIFSLNGLELESLQKGLVTVSTGERSIIKAIFKKC